METVSRSAIFNRFESVAKKKSSLACPPACLGELTGKGGQGGEAGTPRDTGTPLSVGQSLELGWCTVT